MADKSPEALIREKVVAAGGGGRATDTGDTGTPSVEGAPTSTELKHMLTQMRRMNRKNREADAQELAAAKTERERDDVRHRMLWGDVLYRSDIDRVTGKRSRDTRVAEKAMRSHVDMMNKVYGVGLSYPEVLKEGGPVPGSGTPLHEIPTERQPSRVRGAGRLMTPEELDQP